MNPSELGEVFRIVWKTYGPGLLRQSGFWVRKRWQRFHWDAAVAGYADHIRRTHGTVRILTMAAPVPVKDLYVELRILGKPLSFSRISIDSLRNRPRPWEDDHHFWLFQRGVPVPKDTTALVKQQQARLLVLGPPGAGKTTLLKFLALQAIDGTYESIPIFVSLRELSDSGLLLEAFIVQQFSVCNFPDHQGYVSALLRKGKALLLLDGLDEVNEEAGQRRSIASEVSIFVEQYHLNRYIITARAGAVDESFHNFRFVEIAPFNHDQIAKFATKWFYDRSDSATPFLNELHHHDNLLELAQTPLLLTLLCLTFEELNAFPQNRAELYKEAFEVLLRKWDDTRRISRDEFYGKLSLQRRRQLLEAIAYQTVEDGELFFTTEMISRRIAMFLARLPETRSTVTTDDGESVLKAIVAQHGILSERAAGIYAFSHKTFLEFFAARHVVESGRRDTFPILASRLHDRQWREIFLLTAGLIGDADELIRHMAKQATAPLASRTHLRRLLEAVTQKASVIPSTHPRIGLWTFYLRMFLDRDIRETLDKNLQVKQAHDHFISATLELGRTCGFHGLLSLFIGRGIGRAQEDEIGLDVALEMSINTAAQGSSQQDFRIHADRVRELTANLGYDELSAAFEVCISSQISPSPEVHCLERIASRHRKLVLDWSISAADYEALATFLRGLGIISECLNLAPLTDREKVIFQLLVAGEGDASV